MLTPLVGWSLEPPPSEVEFLLRELGIEWRQVREPDLLERLGESKKSLVLSSEPGPYLELASKARPNSLVIVMTSDEAYDPERLKLASASGVARVYRHYPSAQARWRPIVRAALGYVLDSRGTSQSPMTVIPNIRSGLRVRGRMGQWHAHSVFDFPLGYTDTFARVFAGHFDIPKGSSLFEAPIASSSRPYAVSFRGNRGLAQRIVGFELAAAVPGTDVHTVDADWSARAGVEVGEDYVASLLGSRFALCPPGFANNESFRFYEALACGALPIEVSTATTHLGRMSWRSGGSISATSWRKGLAEAQAMSEERRIHRITTARSLVVSTLRQTARKIRADVENE